MQNNTNATFFRVGGSISFLSSLERRIKASSAFGGSKGSDINKLDTDAIPGTNVNAVKGETGLQFFLLV